jgi:hypothetical protein
MLGYGENKAEEAFKAGIMAGMEDVQEDPVTDGMYVCMYVCSIQGKRAWRMFKRNLSQIVCMYYA